MIDNYASTLANIKQYLLDNAPLSDRLRKAFTEYPDAGRSGSISIEFEEQLTPTFKGGCYLYIDLKSEYKNGLSDDQGDWHEFRVTAQVNWASYGSMDPDTALAQIALMSRIATLAKVIQEKFSEPVFFMWRTKEQREQHEAEHQAKQIQRMAETFVKDYPLRKNLRVGSNRMVDKTSEGLPPVGSYTVTVDKKAYTLDISERNTFAWITRTA